MRLEERLVALHRALERGDVPHAFGGAIALAYWTLDPRGTSDIDVNLFVPVAEAPGALSALPAGVEQPPGTTEQVERDGQVRLWWEGTPVDVFFNYLPVHEQAARDRQLVPFLDTEIPVLGPIELAVFKAMFDRTRDWADIEAMLEAGRLDTVAVRASLAALVASDDDRFAKLDAAERAAAASSP